jgi:hypothetical protein
MSPEEVAALADRVEHASGPDRELDNDIAIVTGWQFRFEQHDDFLTEETWISPDGSEHSSLPRFTGSLDAAMALVPNDAFWRVGHDGEGADPSLIKAVIGVAKVGECWVTFRMAVALTGPLALCAAALRAIAHLQKGQP